MIEEFKGYKVPGVEQLDELVRGIKSCGSGILEQIYQAHDCVRCAIRMRCGGLQPDNLCCTPVSVPCNKCIYAFHGNQPREKVGIFVEYLRFKGYMLDVECTPELRPGMICEIADKDHTLVMYLADTVEGRHTGYELQYFATVDQVGVQGVQDFSDQELAAIYADTDLVSIGDPMVLEDLKKCLRLRDNPIWKKPPEAVREMTVDQISEKLGFKVRVIGND